MRRLLFNIITIILTVLIILLNGIRLYNTDKYSTFEIASVTQVKQVSDNNYTIEVLYKTDGGSAMAIVTDVPDWVLSKMNLNKELPVYFHNGDYSTVHVIPYTPLQELCYQSFIIIGISYIVLIIGNSLSKKK